MEAVFVYGTLLTGESNYRVASPFVKSVQPGAVYGRLYDYGPYPKLTLCGEAEAGPLPVVVGEWLEVSKAGLRAMDVLEGYYGPGRENEYERVRVVDAGDSGKEGWIYIGADVRGLPQIASGSWREHRAQREGQLP
ncbi:gamma-glutamylcyclotransferase [Paenibacillus athensensis]|uniref:Gamma-glutamylcyclotransferase n=1 Tax=Paenibacillus athensensis TaxID=1967502 RepID=A0A4Y8PXW1_9BACL|nr:gamma-glutamylcyclotransferase family protein [Paenibacillus athensensis]MCD1259331.1 gamma-glutamylcyclotransferase [Paenibacillus athensensis]